MISEALQRLKAWVDHERHIGASVRHHEPVYENPAALRADVRELIAAYEMPKPDGCDVSQTAQIFDELERRREEEDAAGS